MSVLIPIIREAGDIAFFDLQITLDEITYTLAFRWNVRLEAWFMTVLDFEGVTPLTPDIRLVVDYPLTQYISDRQPTGIFFAVDTEGVLGEGGDPGFDDLGNRVQMHYVPLSELA